MARARALLLHPWIVAALLLTALATRLAVPAGYMPVASAGGVALQLCPGAMPATPEPMVGMHHGAGHDDKDAPPAKAEQPCAFTGLAAPALGSTGPAFIRAALAFAVAPAMRGLTLAVPALPARLRPPLRAPPLTA